MRKYAALISYAGTGYCGWQKQKGSAAAGGPATQEIFESAISTITKEVVSCVGSGRTDSGVHAVGQVVHFILKRREWDEQVLRKGLNSQLGTDIRVLDVKQVPLDFHAQRSATRK